MSLRIVFSSMAAVAIAAAGVGFPANAATELVAANTDRSSEVAAVYQLGACESQQELDCIESFGIRSTGSKSKLSKGRQTSYDASESSRDFLDYPVFGSASMWRIKQGSAKAKTYGVIVSLQSPLYVNDPTFNIGGGSLNISIGATKADRAKTFVLKVRTSWLKALSVEASMVRGSITSKAIPGGTLWTITGAPGISRVFDGGEFFENIRTGATPGSEYVDWFVSINHAAGPTNSYFDPRCAPLGAPEIFADFGLGSSQFQSFSEEGFLEKSFFSPSKNTKGKTVRGNLTLVLPRAYLACQYPDIDFENASSLSLQVVNEEGKKVSGKTKTRLAGGKFIITVNKMTLGYTTLRISPAG
jgi:hypothetical protein